MSFVLTLRGVVYAVFLFFFVFLVLDIFLVGRGRAEMILAHLPH